MADGSNPWTTIDAANQLYLDGLISSEEHERAYVEALGPDDGYLVLGVVCRLLGE